MTIDWEQNMDRDFPFTIDLGSRQPVANYVRLEYLGVNIMFADSAGYQPAVLTAEIYYGYRLAQHTYYISKGSETE